MLPIIFDEFFAIDHKNTEHHNEDERRDAESDVGMKSEAEKHSAENKVAVFLRAKTFEKKIK